MPSIVQSVSGTAAAGPTMVVTMPSNVTSGNLLVVMTGHPGGNECGGGQAATWSDTRGLTYTVAVGAENVSGAQSNACIMTAPITSSGPNSITRTANFGNYPVSMWVLEIGGIASPVLDSTSGNFSDAVSSVNTGNVTSAHTNLLLVGSAAATVAAFDTFSPSGGTSITLGNNGAMAKFVGAGTYSCTFDKSSTGGGRNSACAALISFSAPPAAAGSAGLAAGFSGGQKGGGFL